MDSLPLWVIFVLSASIARIWVEVGCRIYKRRAQEDTKESEAPIGSMVSATLALLAFMLAFTYGIAQSRFEERRLLVVDEANAIGTAYLRADILEEPSRTTVKQLLRSYVSARIPGAGSLQQAIAESERLQKALWAETAVIGQKHPNWPVYSLFISSMNEVIDLHSKRVAAAVYARMPASVWLALFAVGALAMMAIGYYCGLTGLHREPEILIMVLAFSTVLFVVADLDRPFEGSLRTPQQPLIDLQKKLEAQ